LSRRAEIKTFSRRAEIKTLSRRAAIKTFSRRAEIKTLSRRAAIKTFSRRAEIKTLSHRRPKEIREISRRTSQQDLVGEEENDFAPPLPPSARSSEERRADTRG